MIQERECDNLEIKSLRCWERAGPRGTGFDVCNLFHLQHEKRQWIQANTDDLVIFLVRHKETTGLNFSVFFLFQCNFRGKTYTGFER